MKFIHEPNRIYGIDEDGKVRATCSYAVRWLEKHSC